LSSPSAVLFTAPQRVFFEFDYVLYARRLTRQLYIGFFQLQVYVGIR
jgi:hypothetical protein